MQNNNYLSLTDFKVKLHRQIFFFFINKHFISILYKMVGMRHNGFVGEGKGSGYAIAILSTGP